MSKPKSYLFSTFNENYNHFLLYLFFFFAYKWVMDPGSKDWKNQLDFQMQNFVLNILKKNSIKKIKYSRSSPDPENSRSGYQQPYNFFRFLLNSRHFQITQENPNQSIRNRKTSCNWGNVLLLLSQKDRFLELIEKKSLHR